VGRIRVNTSGSPVLDGTLSPATVGGATLGALRLSPFPD
jgi:hypothetical protein